MTGTTVRIGWAIGFAYGVLPLCSHVVHFRTARTSDNGICTWVEVLRYRR
jgi:hypothetical protein